MSKNVYDFISFESLLKEARNDCEIFLNSHEGYREKLRPSLYSPQTHVHSITTNPYYDGLIIVRHHLKRVLEAFFSEGIKAKNVDLFMLTPSISSPMGPGSDSEPIPIKFGSLDTFLVDSSQFGFEPILLQDSIGAVYCYLPSMRGEDPDKRHLNQFFHCELEIRGSFEELIPMVEAMIRVAAETFLSMRPLIEIMSLNPDQTIRALQAVAKTTNFPQVSFDDAYLLAHSKNEEFVNDVSFGRNLKSSGELAVALDSNSLLPTWIREYDRDMVPFYQKPKGKDKVINGDLIFPSLTGKSFGGEIVGAGQRQNEVSEIKESLERQGISSEPYEWYINLRKDPKYRVTSGFGMGIERFIAWALCYEDIKDVILYPRLKNISTLP